MTLAVEELVEVATEVVKHETLAEALLYAQMEYPPLAHNQMVDFTPKSGRRVKYSYADLAHTKKTIGPCLRRHGLVISSSLSEDNTHLITRMRHIHSDDVDETAYEIGKSSDQKEQGGNITWARRYNYGLLTGCVGEEDNDALRISRGSEKQGAARQEMGPHLKEVAETRRQEKDKPDKSLLNRKKDHAFYLSNLYGLTDAQMKEEAKRWYNSKHAEEGLAFTSRSKFEVSDWVGFMEFMGKQLATEHQIDTLEKLVEDQGRWESVEYPAFLDWLTKTLGKDPAVRDILNLSRESVQKALEVLHEEAASDDSDSADVATDDGKSWIEKAGDLLDAGDFDLYLSAAYRVNIAFAHPDVKQAIEDICQKTLSSVKLQKNAREGYSAFKMWMEKIGDKQKIWAFLDVIGGLKEETQDAIFRSLGVPEKTPRPQKIRSISPALFAQYRVVVAKCIAEAEVAEESLS
jgi:hypothetical protein